MALILAREGRAALASQGLLREQGHLSLCGQRASALPAIQGLYPCKCEGWAPGGRHVEGHVGHTPLSPGRPCQHCQCGPAQSPAVGRTGSWLEEGLVQGLGLGGEGWT